MGCPLQWLLHDTACCAGGEEGLYNSLSYPMTVTSHFFCLGRTHLLLDRTPSQSLSSVEFQQNTSTPLPLPNISTATQLQSTRGHPTAELQSPVGQLTMQGVGQHARHTLHHHLVGGLQESTGELGPACLWNWHSWGAKSSYGESPEPRIPHMGSVYLGRTHFVSYP